MTKKTIWTLVGIAAVATVVILVVRKNKKDKEQKSGFAGDKGKKKTPCETKCNEMSKDVLRENPCYCKDRVTVRQ
jgi:hypothetical protein